MSAHNEMLFETLPMVSMRVLARHATTADATFAHQSVITAGLEHIDGRDDCGEQGIRRANVEACPRYLAASALYGDHISQGHRSERH